MDLLHKNCTIDEDSDRYNFDGKNIDGETVIFRVSPPYDAGKADKERGQVLEGEESDDMLGASPLRNPSQNHHREYGLNLSGCKRSPPQSVVVRQKLWWWDS